jgi:hypothetical protein
LHSSRDFFGCGEPLAGFLDADYGRALGRQTQVASRTRMAGPPDCVMRRRLVLSALSSAATLALGTHGSSAQHISAPQKMTQKQAEYQDEPKGGILMCGTCTLFIPPAECKVVEGYVAITGWCNAFDLAD